MIFPSATRKSSQLKQRNDSYMFNRKDEKRDLHALDEHGMVLCNSRDKEASQRAHTSNIATDNWNEVTCPKCVALIYKMKKR